MRAEHLKKVFGDSPIMVLALQRAYLMLIKRAEKGLSLDELVEFDIEHQRDIGHRSEMTGAFCVYSFCMLKK